MYFHGNFENSLISTLHSIFTDGAKKKATIIVSLHSFDAQRERESSHVNIMLSTNQFGNSVFAHLRNERNPADICYVIEP